MSFGRVRGWCSRRVKTTGVLVLWVALLSVLWVSGATAGTTGKISGTIVDQDKQPLPGGTVVVLGQKLGAFSDAQGHYDILNVPAGTYDLNVTSIGYKTLVVKSVVVSSDETTRLDFTVEQTTLAMEEVVITAERPTVDVNQTSSRVSLTSKEIDALPVQDVDDIVNLQAGVVDGHFRGGRLGEVQYQVDGVSVNNPYDNKSTLSLDRSVLQEVQVISGTFDAEYGQAMSGTVNAVLKEGSKEFKYTAEALSGGYVFPGNSSRLTDDTVRPDAQQSLTGAISGPIGLANTVYLLTTRISQSDDFTRATRRFVPTDSSNFESKEFRPTGNGASVALGYVEEWSGAAKISNNSIENVALSYTALWDVERMRSGDYFWHLNPDGQRKQRLFALTHGFDVTRTASRNTFFTLAYRQNYFSWKDMAYDSVWDRRYDAAGPPLGDPSYENGAIVQGVDLGRFQQNTSVHLIKGSISSQVNPEHLTKLGGEVQIAKVEFGSPGYLRFASVNGFEQLVRHIDEPPDFPGVRTYKPLIAAAFAQDQMETKDITLRAGLRFDVFDASSTVPSDPANPANAIAGSPLSTPKATTTKASVSPRLGVAYPITERAGLHFAYGHFYQFPELGQIFANSDYRILSRLQAGGIDYGVLGNPDVKPERTVQYEFGYKQALDENIGYDVSLFYKDIRDLLGVEFIETYNGAQYARLTNVDFGSVIGFTLSFDHRKLGPVSTALDYTWQFAQGNASDPRETAVRASAGEDPRPRQIPFNWDQRHTLNLSATMSREDVYNLSAVLRAASGQPYTPILESGFGNGLDANSGRKPAGLVLDVRADRQISVGGARTTIFGRAFNVFDSRYFNGGVFASTGSPYYSRFPETDRVALINPTRYYPPRRIELGITLNPGF